MAMAAPPGLPLPPNLSLPLHPPPGLSPPGLPLPIHPWPRPSSPNESIELIDFEHNSNAEVSTVASTPTEDSKKYHHLQDVTEFHDDVSVQNHIAGVAAARIEWCIEDLSKKLFSSRGGHLISDVFEIDGVPDLRLVFVPGEKWVAAKRSSKRSKRIPGHLGNMPEYGALKLKYMGSGCSTGLNFDLYVGTCLQGRFECNFSETNLQECIFCFDWLEQFDKSIDRLELRLDFC